MHGLLLGLFGLLLRIPLCLLFYGTPLLGFWLASSLAAFLGGPHYLPWVAGLLLFPIIPGFWELYDWSHRRKDASAILTPVDRLSLRTFVVGLAFLIGLLYFYPQAAFVSLSTRGDWMLDDVKDPRAETARRYLFAAAGGLEWLYRATRKNPYKDQIDPKAQQLAQEAAQDLSIQQQKEAAQQEEKKSNKPDLLVVTQDKNKSSDPDDLVIEVQEETTSKQEDEQQTSKQHEAKPTQEELPQAGQTASAPEKKWPWTGMQSLHPAVATMPPEVETSIESVAKYIAKKEKDPVLRIKALHDYVADRVAYDAEAYYSGNIPEQDAKIVFKKRKSVCSGYSNLMAALAAAINEKVIVIGGDARDPDNGDKLTGDGHAWNAVCIKKKWWLMDVCWDSGNVSRDKGFTKAYRTDYLLLPPEVMIQNHFPDEPTWQLLARPLSQGEFLRQPMLDPSFQAADLTLVSPKRARNETDARAVVVLNNPDNKWLLAGLEQNGRRLGFSTEASNEQTVKFDLPLPNKGTYRLNMFMNNQRAGSFAYVGSVDFVNR